MAPRDPIVLPADLLEWRPMLPMTQRKPVDVIDPVLEPLWSGVRVIAHIGTGEQRVRLIDPFGVDIAADAAELVALLADAVDAGDAIVDGVLTDQATRGGVGAAAIAQPRSSMASLITRQDPGVEIKRTDEHLDPVEAFVALDLLRVDGQSLLDLPLLERKRLLESVITQSDRIRVSVHCRPPIDAWVATWQGAGLRGAMLKAANSRYTPGGRTDEWRTVTRVAGRR